MKRALYIIISLLLLSACNDNSNRSSVPSFPVRIRIDTRIGHFVNFTKDCIGSYMTVDKDGYKLNGTTVQTLLATDAYGYSGVVIYVHNYSDYAAFDMCCPKCLLRSKPIEINGAFGVCPTCHEEYELLNGLGTPTKGIAKEGLRRYISIYASGVLQVSN